MSKHVLSDETKLLQDCKIFKVVELPANESLSKRQHTKYWIEHKPTVCIVAINDNDEILLIEQFRWPPFGEMLEIPAGAIEEGEEPMIAAQRELAEEIGYKARTLILLFEGYLTPGYCNEYMYFFLATDLVYDPLKPDDDEDIKVVPVKIDEIISNHMYLKKIIDVKTALGLALSKNHLNYLKNRR